MEEIRVIGVDTLTLSQYLCPPERHVPIVWYVTPGEFDQFRSIGFQMGFKSVPVGPLVRSSYRAAEIAGTVLEHLEK